MAVTNPPTKSKRKMDAARRREEQQAAMSSASSSCPSAAVLVDIIRTSDHCNQQQEQALFPLAASSPARTAETTQTRPSASEDENNDDDSDDDDVEKQQGQRTATTPPAPASASASPSAATNYTQDAHSMSSVSIGSKSFGKKRSKTFMKTIVPKGIRKQGRRLFNVVKHATAANATTGHDDNDHYHYHHDAAAVAIANEATPLLVANQQARSSSSLMGTTTTTGAVLTLPPEKKVRIVAAWKRLAQRVKSGELLLETSSRDSNSFHDSDHLLDDNDYNDDCLDEDFSGMDAETIRQYKRRKAQQAIQSGLDFSLWQCLMAIILYMGIAVIAFKFILEPSWTVIDSMYFAMVTFTTIGYGDLAPHNHLGRIFTIIYALSGVACLGIALGVLGNSVIEAQHQAAEKTKELAEQQVISLFSSDDDDDDNTENNGGNAVAVCKESKVKEENPILQELAKEFVFVFIILIVFACLMADDPGVGETDHWDIVNAIYYAIMTATTVGYGDFAPQLQKGRLIAIIFIPLAVGAMGKFLSIVASVIMDVKQDSFRRKMHHKELTYQDLEIMDADGNGIVTQAEFIEFMLVAMNKVDKNLMDELRLHFNRLDADGTGSLSKEDLIYNARNRLRTSAKKMELKAYKEKLLAQSAEAKSRREQQRGMGPKSSNKQKRTSFFQRSNNNIV